MGAHLNEVGLILFTLLYFAVAYLIALNPSKILDRIGRVLTPVFAILIVLLVILGIVRYGYVTPQSALENYAKSSFGIGFSVLYIGLGFLSNHFPVPTAEFFSAHFPRMRYQTYTLLFTLISLMVANFGLDAIIKYSLPVLQILYPITIVTVVLIVINKFLPLSK